MTTATAIHQQTRIDLPILSDISEEVAESFSNGESQEFDEFDILTSKIADTISPALEGLLEAYLVACRTPAGRQAANLFLQNMLAAEG